MGKSLNLKHPLTFIFKYIILVDLSNIPLNREDCVPYESRTGNVTDNVFNKAVMGRKRM